MYTNVSEPHRRREFEADETTSFRYAESADFLDSPSSSVPESSINLNVETALADQTDIWDSRIGEGENGSDWLSNSYPEGFWDNDPFHLHKQNQDELGSNPPTVTGFHPVEMTPVEGGHSISTLDVATSSLRSAGALSPLPAAISSTHGVSTTSQNQMDEINKFFNELYPVYPLVNKADLYQRISSAEAGSDRHLQMLLLAIPIINLGRSYRMSPGEACKNSLQAHITTLEQRRTEYDFAETPTLDTVVVSFLLFCVTNVLSKHHRAFLYLSEVRDLFDFVSQRMREQNPTDDDLRRSARIELTIFIAEAATHSIYGAGGFYKRRRRSVTASIKTLQEKPAGDMLEMHIDSLLLQLTVAHAGAINPAAQQSKEDLSSFTIHATNYPISNNGCLTGIQKQAADVVITTHWRAIETLAMSIKSRQSPDSQRRLVQALCEKSSSALASSCALDEGFLRVVGIGKLALIAYNILNVVTRACGPSALDQCKNVLAGLCFTVVKTDYEGSFLMMLRDCINLVSGANDIRVPPGHLLLQAPGRIVGNIREQRDEPDEINTDFWKSLLNQPA